MTEDTNELPDILGEDLGYLVATDRDDALNDFQSLAESYDALVANSSAEHQRISDLLQALSANVIRLDEEKEQDRHTIEYWKGQYEQASERVHDLECHALEIVEHAREQDARLKDLEGAVSAPMPLDRNMRRLRTMFGIEPGTPDSETFTIIERYDAANLRTIDSLRDHVAMHARLGQLAHQQAERWQGMAEDLWEELQEWHTENCGQADHGTPIGAPCTCHGILAAKWDEITHADDWTDDEADS